MLLHLRGYQNKEIAEVIGYTEHTIGKYIHDFYTDEVERLSLRHSPGAPRRLSEAQKQQLRDTVLTHTTDEAGFTSYKNWKIALIQQWVKNTLGVEYGHRGMADVLYRLESSYTRPTYTLTKADPKAKEVFKQGFEGKNLVGREN